MRIFSKLDEMIGYVEELKEMLPEDEEDYLQDLVSRRACEKTIEVAIDSLIDASAMVVSAEKFGLPASEEGIFDILVRRKVISRDLGEILKDLKGFRNILIHRYAHVADDIVYYNLSKYLDDFYLFKSIIESYLEIEK
ncbi:MAG: DUF86 domain-containing protein [ANME-2 cluster archaeon]|jgi:uncharacterized protein YutE (UPF0331/DUF86 family)|nr:DUF86 domain-containing protein [ANME-2 cluster archaeon]